MNPSDFRKHPYDSVTHKTEAEVVACNIMVILARTGNEWRQLGLEEYRSERIKDGRYGYSEDEYFVRVAPYTVSEETARLFSQVWRDVKGE